MMSIDESSFKGPNKPLLDLVKGRTLSWVKELRYQTLASIHLQKKRKKKLDQILRGKTILAFLARTFSNHKIRSYCITLSQRIQIPRQVDTRKRIKFVPTPRERKFQPPLFASLHCHHLIRRLSILFWLAFYLVQIFLPLWI
jgi:hypothetical protein